MIKQLRKPRPMPSTPAEWFAARQSGRADPAFDQAFEKWLAADPEHQRQYALCEIAWDLSRPIAEGLRMSLPSAPVRMPAPRRRWVHGVGLAAAVLIAVIPLWYTLAGREAQSIHYATVAGEQRTITLADGSRVTLNTRTGLEALIGDDRREVVLESGEAFFEVAHDPVRPFRVLTSLGIVSVLGTRFAVYDRLQSVEVTTEQGLVRVSSAGLPESIAAIHVRSGESAVITAPDARPRLQKADLERIENWRNQRLEFNAVPLADLLEEFSRYTPVPLQAANAETGAIRVSGVFRIGDVSALSKTLHAAFGLVVRSSDAGRLIVERSQDGTTDRV